MPRTKNSLWSKSRITHPFWIGVLPKAIWLYTFKLKTVDKKQLINAKISQPQLCFWAKLVKIKYSPTKFNVNGKEIFDKVNKKYKVEKFGMYIVNPPNSTIDLVWNLSYKQPTIKKSPADVKPWANIKIKPPITPVAVCVKTPRSAKFIWIIDEYAITRVKSTSAKAW